MKRGALGIIDTSETQEKERAETGFLFSEHGLIPTALGKAQSNCFPLVFVQITFGEILKLVVIADPGTGTLLQRRK